MRFSCGSKNPPAMWKTWVQSLGWEDLLEKETATHSSILAWKIPWMEEPGGLQSMGSLRVRCDWATSLSLFTFMHWRRKWQPTPVSCLENPRDGGAWWAAIYGVAQSQTQLKRLSSSSIKLLNYQWENCRARRRQNLPKSEKQSHSALAQAIIT